MINDSNSHANTTTDGKITARSRNNRNEIGTSRRSFLRAAGAGTVTTTLAGCLGGGGEDVVRIGHLAPRELDMGIGATRSAEMAVEEINDDGGIMDGEVELVTRDSAGIPSEASSEAQSMVQQENIDVMIGTFVSEVALGIIDFLADQQVPFIVSGSASPDITRDHAGEEYDQYRNVFRVNSINTDFQAELLADYAEFLSDEHGWNSFAVMPENAAWTRPFSEILPPQLDERGFEVALDERISRDTDDFTPILDQVEANGADVMFKTFAHIPGPGMLSTWRENEYPFSQEGINVASMSPEFWDDTGGGCLYETTAESGAGGTASVTDNTIPFTEAYQERHDERPSAPMYMGFGSYDAVHIYREAVETAGTADYEEDLDAIVDAMLETDHVGTAGRIQFFGPDHEFPHDVKPGPDLAPFPVQQWQETGGGEKVCVFPRDIATDEHVMPEWMA